MTTQRLFGRVRGWCLAWIATAVVGLVLDRGFAQEASAPSFAELAKNPEVTKLGFRLFTMSCAICHTAALPEGDPMNHRDAVWRHGSKPEEIEAVVRNGVPNTRMNGFGTLLKPQQIQAIVAYMVSLQATVPPAVSPPEPTTTTTPVPAVPAVPVPPAQ